MNGGAKTRQLDLQARDYAVLRGLYESRVMTTRHMTTLYFNNQQPYAYKRIAALAEVGLIAERDRVSAHLQRVFYLTKSGYDKLLDADELNELPLISWSEMQKRIGKLSASHLAHELAVMDVKAAIVPAIEKLPGPEIVHFSTWPRLHAFKVRDGHGESHPMRADAFLRVRWTHREKLVEQDFFIEVDRSTEVQEILAEKARVYRQFINSKGYARDFCGVATSALPTADVAQYHFTVLCIVLSDARLTNAIERLLAMRPPIKRLVWMACMRDVLVDPLGTIWTRPCDHRTPGRRRCALLSDEHDV